MTLAEWLACDDPEWMLRRLEGKLSERTLRLFAAACCRRIRHLMDDPRSEAAIEVGERLADGLVSAPEQEAAKAAAQAVCRDYACTRDYYTPAVHAARAAYHVVSSSRLSVRMCASAAVEAVTYTGQPIQTGAPLRRSSFPPSAEPAAQCALLRDLSGRLRRPHVRLAEAVLGWGGGAARKVAEGIYRDRTQDDLFALADALEEGGCDDQDLLGHLRSEGPHVRGCWVVDTVLGKE
jgi:hypothetical protein